MRFLPSPLLAVYKPRRLKWDQARETRCAVALAVMSIAGTALPAQDAAVVENPAPAQAPVQLAVSPQPLTIIGWDADANAGGLWNVRHAVLTASGSVVLATGRVRELREYDARGQLLRTIGRTGAGPGEYRSIDALVAIPGDSLAIYDARLRRITLFGPSRRVVRTVRTPADARCCSPSGAYLVLRSSAGEVGKTPQIGYSLFGVARWDSVQSRSPNAPLAGNEGPGLRLAISPPRIIVNPETNSGGFFGFGPVHTVPFYVRPMLAFTHDAVVNATGERYEFDVFSLGGPHRRTVHAAVSTQPVTRRDIARAREELSTRISDAAEERAVLHALDDLALPDIHPQIDRILPGDNGGVWVRSYHTSETEAQEWAQFDAAGVLRARLLVPGRYHLLHFGADRVISIEEDAGSGLQVLRVHRIESARSGRVR